MSSWPNNCLKKLNVVHLQFMNPTMYVDGIHATPKLNFNLSDYLSLHNLGGRISVIIIDATDFRNSFADVIFYHSIRFSIKICVCVWGQVFPLQYQFERQYFLFRIMCPRSLVYLNDFCEFFFVLHFFQSFYVTDSIRSIRFAPIFSDIV